MGRAITKLLIANRGEIAIRVMRSAREMGIATVSVHSEADENSLHVKLADESVCIGPAKSSLSYLNIASVLSACEISGADAVHPGYGFLSENHEFAAMCEKWGLKFVGPRAECLRLMGSKVESKKIAKQAGVPVLESILVNEKTEQEILKSAAELGYPVLIKASAGGGGKGMEKIESEKNLISKIKRLQQEAKAAFADDTLFIEKYIENPRHIEVQILADQHGNIIHLGERDCTIQRRYQKLIEESPCAILNDEQRDEICQSAVNLARAVHYDSVGTVEFIYDQDAQKYYFMEMNTRIQVEHPVTEQRTGVDLISQQIAVATGQELSLRQEEIRFQGHVIECRINAEDPISGVPSPGVISHYHRPAGLGVRVDDFIYTGYRVPPYYDSMISKVIVSAEDRNKSIDRMLRALDETIIGGIKTNVDLHKRILRNSRFREQNYNTNFLSTLK